MFRFTRQRARYAAGVFAAAVILLFGYAAQCAEDTAPAKPPAEALTSCLRLQLDLPANKTIALGDVRFLFSCGNTYCVELTYDAKTVVPAFQAEFPGSPPFGFGDPLPPKQQEWLLKQGKEQIGDAFFCIDLLAGKSARGRIRAIAGCAEGMEGDVAFLGVLDAALPVVPDDVVGRLAGVAYRAVDNTGATFKPVEDAGTKKTGQIQAALRSQLNDATCTVLSAVQNPADNGFLAVAEHTRTQLVGKLQGKETVWSPETIRGTSVFYLLNEHEQFQLVPFVNVPYAIEVPSERGFPLDIYPGYHGDTRFGFLPDLDRDGRDELLVFASEGFVFSMKPQGDATTGAKPALDIVHNFHFGMGE